jgi:predicted phosphoribosyltransferase
LELEEFWAVGVYYQDFAQVTDEQVIQLLRRAWTRSPNGQARASSG